MTVSVVRQILTALLRGELATRVADNVSQVLRRTEEARIYHWQRATGRFPPPRPKPATNRARNGPGNYHAQ
jgi:hypothetical protein